MQNGLNDKAPDPGTLYLAIGIGVFSVLASFVLAIYYSGAADVSAADVNAADVNVASGPIDTQLDAGAQAAAR